MLGAGQPSECPGTERSLGLPAARGLRRKGTQPSRSDEKVLLANQAMLCVAADCHLGSWTREHQHGASQSQARSALALVAGTGLAWMVSRRPLRGQSLQGMPGKSGWPAVLVCP